MYRPRPVQHHCNKKTMLLQNPGQVPNGAQAGRRAYCCTGASSSWPRPGGEGSRHYLHSRTHKAHSLEDTCVANVAGFLYRFVLFCITQPLLSFRNIFPGVKDHHRRHLHHRHVTKPTTPLNDPLTKYKPPQSTSTPQCNPPKKYHKDTSTSRSTAYTSSPAR